MARIELREISERLGTAADSEAVISALIKYLEQMHKDWRSSVALYECSSDRLVSVHALGGEGLVSRDIDLAVDNLPVRLVRKFFHHAVVAQSLGKRLVLNLIFRNSPFYRADEVDRESLAPLVPIDDWKSCICFPLADSEDVIAMLVIASRKRNAFPSRAVGEILPLNSVAAMALAQHLYRAAKGRLEEEVKTVGARATAELQEKLGNLDQEKQGLSSKIEQQAKTISDLLESMSHLDSDSSQYRDEQQRLQTAIFALEEQSSAATEHLADAYAELTRSNFILSETQTTTAFMRTLCDVLAQEHSDNDLPTTLLNWYCDYFGIERFSLMAPDPRGETLSIVYSRGITDDIVRRVRMRVGQGISGWVAHNRKPLLVQSREEDTPPHTDQDHYNSDSFLSVPLVHDNVLYGVVNFSNKREGAIFNEADLDRAGFLSAFLAMTYERIETPRRRAAGGL
jgi:transcriptional regulator with GAF, ATPase, and Fis domain